MFDMGNNWADEELFEIAIQEWVKPSEPVKIQVISAPQVIEIVENDVEVADELNFDDLPDEPVEVAEFAAPGVAEADDRPLLLVEQMPRFQGRGVDAFHAWVMSRLVYPRKAGDSNVSGQVTLSFIVERDGGVTNITVKQSTDKLFSDEAVRVLRQSPKWEPGRRDGVAVRVKFYMPVIFSVR